MKRNIFIWNNSLNNSWLLDKNKTGLFHTAVIKVLTFHIRKEMEKNPKKNNSKTPEDLSMREGTLCQNNNKKNTNKNSVYESAAGGWAAVCGNNNNNNNNHDAHAKKDTRTNRKPHNMHAAILAHPSRTRSPTQPPAQVLVLFGPAAAPTQVHTHRIRTHKHTYAHTNTGTGN